jgi:hypothetical protein
MVFSTIWSCGHKNSIITITNDSITIIFVSKGEGEDVRGWLSTIRKYPNE